MSNPYAPPDPNRPRPPTPLPAAPPSPPPPPDPTVAAQARRLVTTTFLLVLASLVVRLLPAPWSATSVVFALVGLVVAVQAAIVGRRAQADRPTLLAAAVMVFAAGFGLMIGTASLALLPAQTEYEHCLAGAVTESGKNACTQTYEDAVDTLQEQLSRGSLGGG